MDKDRETIEERIARRRKKANLYMAVDAIIFLSLIVAFILLGLVK